MVVSDVWHLQRPDGIRGRRRFASERVVSVSVSLRRNVDPPSARAFRQNPVAKIFSSRCLSVSVAINYVGASRVARIDSGPWAVPIAAPAVGSFGQPRRIKGPAVIAFFGVMLAIVGVVPPLTSGKSRGGSHAVAAENGRREIGYPRAVYREIVELSVGLTCVTEELMVVPVRMVSFINPFRNHRALVGNAVVILAVVTCAWRVESEEPDVLAHRGYPPRTILAAVSNLVPVR